MRQPGDARALCHYSRAEGGTSTPWCARSQRTCYEPEHVTLGPAPPALMLSCMCFGVFGSSAAWFASEMEWRVAQVERKKLLSVVVPVYGSESILPHTYARLTEVLSGLPDLDYEIVFVNDASPESSLAVLRGFAEHDERAKIVSLSRNFGHQVAISAGLDVACGDAVVTIDDDLQDPPQVIAEMVSKWREGFGVVYGKRTERRGEGSFKRASAAVFYRTISWLSETPLPLDTGDFRLLDRRAADVLRNMREESRYIRGMVSWVGFEQSALPYSRDPRHSGQGHYTLRKLFRLVASVIMEAL